jgi:hypothetical protein
MFHGGLLFLVLCVGLYFLPSIIGAQKHNATAILAVNLLLGWTVVGWIVALVWALSDRPAPPAYQPAPGGYTPPPQYTPPPSYTPPPQYTAPPPAPSPAPAPAPAGPATQTRYCSRCGSALRAGDKFCAGCGSAVPGI